MIQLKQLFSHSYSYLIGHFIIMLHGFISFPILTRVLSVEEYGYMGLIITTIALTVAISKLGLQHAAVRFYGSLRKERKLKELYSTLLLFPIGLGLLFYINFLGLPFILKPFINNGTFFYLLAVAGLLVPFCIGVEIYLQILRAQQYRLGLLESMHF